MNILLIGNYLQQQQQSMQKFAELLQRGLQSQGHVVRLLRPPVLLGRLLPGESGLAKWIGYVDRYVIFPVILRWHARWADLVHVCDQANAMYLAHVRKASVLTCHDLFAIRSAKGEIEQNRTGWTGKLLQAWTLSSLRKWRHIVCVSQQTCDELMRIAQVRRQQVRVVLNGLNYPYERVAGAQLARGLAELRLENSGRFLLHVGGNDWYKNRLGVLNIFAQLRKQEGFEDLSLVMAGKPFTEEMSAFVSQAGLEGQVHERCSVSDQQLAALYSAASALLFPSLQEGFGWPVIEAQACECPVITSDRAPLPEVSGGSAILIDPQDPAAAAARIACNWAALPELAVRGVSNAARFTERRMVEQYLAAYEWACSPGQERCAE